MLGFFSGLWGKVLIVGAIVVAALGVLLKMQGDAKKAGRLVEREEQRQRNEEIRRKQKAVQGHNPDNIDDILASL